MRRCSAVRSANQMQWNPLGKLGILSRFSLEKQEKEESCGGCGMHFTLTFAYSQSCFHICCLAPNTRSLKSRYVGHYVVLCGYDLTSRKLYYHNPEVHDGRE